MRIIYTSDSNSKLKNPRELGYFLDVEHLIAWPLIKYSERIFILIKMQDVGQRKSSNSRRFSAK